MASRSGIASAAPARPRAFRNPSDGTTMTEEHSDQPEHPEIIDQPATPRGRAFLWGGLVLGVLFVLLLYTHGFGLFAGQRTPEAPPLVEQRGASLFVPETSALRSRLTVATVAAVPVSGRLLLPAVVESDPARTAALLSPLAGRVAELRVRPGDRVSAGQVLAVIDSPDLGQAYEDDVKAADTLNLTKKNLERQEGQAKIGALSERDLDQARSDHRQAAAEYARTQARLRALGVKGDNGSRLLTLRAPFAGSITALNVATGNMINDPTQPVLTLVHVGTVWVTALVAEKDVPKVRLGQEAQVRLDAAPDEVLKGTVMSVNDVLEPDSHRNKVRIAFANEAFTLKPNMYASVTLISADRPQIVVPTSALLMNNDRTSVFVATAPWTFERRTVEPDLQEGTSVPILSGLKAGDQVVIKGGILLND
jgi:cobalt-zinc-cadmium efflux system membrane fusion protein